MGRSSQNVFNSSKIHIEEFNKRLLLGMIQLSLNITEVNKLENMRNFAACKKRVVEALAYFDIFQYPLTNDEIRQFLSVKVDENFLQDCLYELQEEKIIFLSHGFYSIQNNQLQPH